MAGETALARQLKKLAVPQTTLLIQDKIKKSFLFDHRDAAGLDRDVIFAYGTNGLEKLCLVNPRFKQFEANLFNVTHKDFERSVQSREANAKLDEKVSLFLKMLSPYFLLRGAHEALEWLVHRFHVHMFNVDDLVASALPHFSTSTFVRVVQLLDLDEGSRWFWLKPIQKSGVHLEYSAILNRFLSDDGFRKFVCNLAPDVVAVYKDSLDVATPVISFSMLTVYNALAGCQTVDDKLILMLFPYILKGLKSGLNQYVAASYLVISQIVVKVKLTADVIEKIVLRVFDAVKTDLISLALKLLLLFFQHQSMKSIPKQVHWVIVSNKQSLNVLCDLTSDYQAHLLARAVIKRSLNEIFIYPLSNNTKQTQKQVKFLKNFLAGSKLRGKSVTLCFDFTLKKYLECSKNAQNYKIKPYEKAAKSVFKALERKYPEFFDKALKDYIEKNPKVNNQIYLLINNSVCSIKHRMAPDTKTPFVIGLNHVNPQIRKTSIMQLIEVISKEDFSESEFLADSLHDRLLDDDPKVVETILKFPEVILRFLEKSRILKLFEEIFKRNVDKKSPWYPVFISCSQFIIQNFCSDEDAFNLLPFIVKFVYPVNEHTEEGFLLLLNANICNFLIAELKSLKSEVTDDENYVLINCKIVSLTKQSIDKMNNAQKYELSTFLSSKIPELQCHSFISFYVVAMEHIIMTSHQNTVELTEEFLQVLRFYLSSSSKTVPELDGQLETVVGGLLISYPKNKFPVSLLLYAFKNICVAVASSLDKTIDNSVWPDTQAEDFQVLNKMFGFCILALNSFKGALKRYFKSLLLLMFKEFKEMKHAFKFLCTKWVSYDEEVPLVLQLSSLRIALKLAQKITDSCWVIQDDAIFFCLLRAVSYPDESVCRLAMSLLCSLSSDLKEGESSLYALVKEIKTKRDEILVDSSQCFYCIRNYFKAEAEVLDTQQKDIEQGLDNNIQIMKANLSHFLKLINQTVPLSIKCTVLLCLQDVESAYILSAYVPLLEISLAELQKVQTKNEKVLDVIELILKKFNPISAKRLVENSKETKALFNCLRFKHENDADGCVQKLALRVLSKEFFSALPSVKIQLQIFHVLLELYMDSSSSLNSEVAKTLRKLSTYAHIFLKHFQEKELKDVRGSTLREAKRFKTAENVDATKEFEDGSWKKLTVLLELMQNKSKLMQMDLLIPDLFNLLNKSLDLDNQASVEYIRQLILSVIYNCCQLLGAEKLDERQFQVELIVQCIRLSNNAKTHQQALLLLNLAARMFPDYVLSNVMSIFTFMGSSLVRQDDSYSFQVISQTIETVVPSLMEASNQQTESDGIQVVASVIRVFVDSLVDIPGHRQLPLFTKLLSTLDPSRYLWIPIGQICDQYATIFHSIVTDHSKNWKLSPALEFAVNLHKQFSPNIQIDTCIELANFLSNLPDTKQQLEENSEKYANFKEPFDVANCDVKQLQVYKINVLSYMKIWLSSQEFLSQVSELNTKEQTHLEVKYEHLMEAVLRLLQDRINRQQAKSEDKNISDQILILYDLVHAINALLPCKLFIRVIRSILKNAEREIQVKAIEFLNAKLEQQESFEAEHKKSLQKLLRPLLKFISACTSDEVQNPRMATTLQATLYSLHLLCKSIGADYPTKFYPVLTVSIQILTNYHQPELMVNALLCLAQLCSCLNVDILPHLNSFMPVIISILQDKSLNMNECLILGVVAAMHSIIENLGMFLSSYMEDIITGVGMFFVKYSNSGKKNICEKFEMLQNKIANDIALRVLLGAIENCYFKMTSETAITAVPLMKILTEKLNSSSYEDILASAIELQKFYLVSLDFRNSNQNVHLKVTDNVEDSVVLSFKTFVMKLSVSRFRTLFQKLYQWATTTIEDQEQKLRVYTFYKLTSEFSKSLKSLFTPMSKYFFRHISTVLDFASTSSSKSLYFEENEALSYKLLCNCIDTLNFCFMFAEEQFLDKENFEILLQPLVDQIENLSFEDWYPDFIENHLSSCIAHFMSAVSDNVQWKALNYQILLKTRHSSPKVRFGSLQVIQQVVSKMSDNYLVLLPESIPFLAEIMEDESTEVEQECQNVIIEMEKILGEPIRKYF